MVASLGAVPMRARGFPGVFAVVVLLAVLACPTAPAGAGPQALLTGPTQAVGDGATVVRLELTTPVANVRAEDIEVSTGAGVVRKIEAVDSGRFAIELVPPRVATALEEKLTARALRGGWRTRPLAITFTPPPFPQGQHRSGGPFQLTHPKRLLLGADPTASLRVTAKDGEAPRLFVSEGAVSGWRPGTDGRLHATFTPTADKFPRVAVIVAVSPDGRTVDSGTIALWGVPRMQTRTAARAKVVWRLGSQAYGPLTASATGKASMVVLAPPGVRTGQVVATDAAGNQRVGAVDLGETRHGAIVAVCPRGGARLLVVAADDRGDPIAADRLELSSSLGKLSALSTRSSGVYEATLAIEESVDLDAHAAIEARLRGSAVVRSRCVADVPGAQPSQIRVSVDPERWTAGSKKPVTIVVALSYPEGRRPMPLVLPLEVTLGQVELQKPDTHTRLTAQWTLPNKLPANRRAVVTAQGHASRIAGSAELVLTAGPTERLRLAAGHTTLAADGESSTEISARAVDRFDNGRIGARFVASGRGTVSAFRHVGDGRYVATYRSPVSDAALVDHVIVRELRSDTEATLPLALVPPPSPLWTGFGWAAVGVGGAGLVVGAVTGGLAMDRHATLDDGCNGDVCPPSADDDLAAFRSLRTASTVGYVGGAIFAAAGLSLLLFAPGAPDTAASGVWVGPGTVGTTVHF